MRWEKKKIPFNTQHQLDVEMTENNRVKIEFNEAQQRFILQRMQSHERGKQRLRIQDAAVRALTRAS